MGNRPHDEQAAALEELKAQRARREAEKHAPPLRQPLPAASSSAEPTAPGNGDYAVIGEAASAQRARSGAAGGKEPTPRTESVPEPRTDREADRPGAAPATRERRTSPSLPYDDGAALAVHLIQKMNDTELDEMLRILNEHQRTRRPAATVPASDAIRGLLLLPTDRGAPRSGPPGSRHEPSTSGRTAGLERS